MKHFFQRATSPNGLGENTDTLMYFKQLRRQQNTNSEKEQREGEHRERALHLNMDWKRRSGTTRTAKMIRECKQIIRHDITIRNEEKRRTPLIKISSG